MILLALILAGTKLSRGKKLIESDGIYDASGDVNYVIPSINVKRDSLLNELTEIVGTLQSFRSCNRIHEYICKLLQKLNIKEKYVNAKLMDLKNVNKHQNSINIADCIEQLSEINSTKVLLVNLTHKLLHISLFIKRNVQTVVMNNVSNAYKSNIKTDRLVS